MTKKELTSLLVAFLGGWLFIQMLIALVMPLTTTIPTVWAATGRGFTSEVIWTLLAGFIPASVYGVLAWLIIKRSNSFADWLLHHAKVGKEERIEGIPVAGLSPLLFSMVGLYFILATAPSFVMSAARWFAFEAQTASPLLGIDHEAILERSKSQMIYDALVFAVAFGAFRWPNFFVALVKTKKTEPNKSVQTTAMTPPPSATSGAPLSDL